LTGLEVAWAKRSDLGRERGGEAEGQICLNSGSWPDTTNTIPVIHMYTGYMVIKFT
jgi:hypothetical protein